MTILLKLLIILLHNDEIRMFALYGKLLEVHLCGLFIHNGLNPTHSGPIHKEDGLPILQDRNDLKLLLLQMFHNKVLKLALLQIEIGVGASLEFGDGNGRTTYGYGVGTVLLGLDWDEIVFLGLDLFVD